MTQTATTAARKTLSARLDTNPKTLHRKAMEKAASAPKDRNGESLEELFPASAAEAGNAGLAPNEAAPLAAYDSASAVGNSSDGVDQALAAPTVDIIESNAMPQQADEPSATPPSIVVEDQVALAAPSQPAAPSTWSEADERAFQAMSTRRKAAGFQRRGRDVSAQRLTVGQIKPNDGTVVATIVGIVADKGTVGRGELIDLMAATSFANAKAKPADKGWCTGYIAGAIRDGFLALADDAIVMGEHSPEAKC